MEFNPKQHLLFDFTFYFFFKFFFSGPALKHAGSYFPSQGIEPVSPELRARSQPRDHQGNPA